MSLYRLSILASLCCLVACGGGGSSAPAVQPTLAQPATATVDDPTSANVDTSQTEDKTQIRLLGLYTDGVTEHATDVDLRIQHLVNVANDILTESGVRLEFVLDHLEWVDYPDQPPIEQALHELTFAEHASIAHVSDLRDTTQADLVVLFRPYANDGQCGFAWIGGYQTDGDFSHSDEPDYAYSVVASNCSDYTLLHELGHNLGLAHSRREDPDGGSLTYGAGFGLNGDFVTIMASPSQFNATQLPRLASPGLNCNDTPCGVDHNDAERGADAVRALRIAQDQVAGYR